MIDAATKEIEARRIHPLEFDLRCVVPAAAKILPIDGRIGRRPDCARWQDRVKIREKLATNLPTVRNKLLISFIKGLVPQEGFEPPTPSLRMIKVKRNITLKSFRFSVSKRALRLP